MPRASKSFFCRSLGQIPSSIPPMRIGGLSDARLCRIRREIGLIASAGSSRDRALRERVPGAIRRLGQPSFPPPLRCGENDGYELRQLSVRADLRLATTEISSEKPRRFRCIAQRCGGNDAEHRGAVWRPEPTREEPIRRRLNETCFPSAPVRDFPSADADMS